MALPDYQDDGTGTPVPNQPQDSSSDGGVAARRAFIAEEFRRIMGYDPSESDLNDAYNRYMAEGGEAFRAWLGARAQSGGGQGGGLGDLISYDGPFKPSYDFGQAPGFEFDAPTADDVYADPSFNFRRGLGQKGIESSAAARGMLRTGGTLKDILGYNQNFASQEYGNIYDRRFQEAQARFRPRFDEWMFKSGAEKDAGDKEWQRRWDSWTYDRPSGSEILNAGTRI